MATTVAPERITTNGQRPTFGDLTWLDAQHEVYKANVKAWKREEKRGEGGDAVLGELEQFDGESDPSFEKRKGTAQYQNFPLSHVRAITGELSKKRPTLGKGLSFGGLGEVRPRDKQAGAPTYAELVKYNVDGVGQDGSEFEAWMDAVDERAQITGHRWLMVESSNGAGRALTLSDVLAGNRPFAVEYSPIDVPNWFFLRGQLQFAVIRCPVEEPEVDGATFTDPDDGYYLLVRKGCTNLGPEFEGGGWWLFDSDKGYIDSGEWSWDSGDIPLWIHYGQRSKGTKDIPAISRSSTMELGQIAVGRMNIESAWRYDAWDACASILYFLGADPGIMTAVAEQHANRSIRVGVPFPDDGKGGFKQIQVFDGSTGAVSAEVMKLLITAMDEAAREQSFQQITSRPDSSGASKEAGHAENKAPILAMRARERQQSENTLIYFFELRFGIAKPSGSSQWPTDFSLAPLVDAIDAAFDTLRRSKLRSMTAEVKMAMASLEERGIVNDENRAVIQQELEQSYADQQATEEATRKALGGAGGFPPET